MDSAIGQSAEHDAKAREFRRRAENIEQQAKRAIYSDDPDAAERLAERIAGLEAQRQQMKQRNADYRKAHREELRAMSAYARDRAMPHPGFELSNLSGNIARLRRRLEALGA